MQDGTVMYQTPWFKIIKRDGHHVLHEPKSVKGAAVLILVDETHAVLVSQYRHGTSRNMLEIPRGYAEPEESSQECALREVYEETGFELQAGDVECIGHYSPNSSVLTSTVSIFRATAMRTQQRDGTDLHEVDHVELLNIDELERKIADGEITDGFTQSALYLHRLKPIRSS